MPPTVIFMHIPKAAGSTFKSVLWREYGRSAVFDFRAPTMHEDFARFLALSPRERARFRAIQGHVPFGLHRLIEGPCRYVTLLRDPVDRLVSTYRFVRATPHHPDHIRVAADDFTFADFIDMTDRNGRLNLQTLWLSGVMEVAADRPAGPPTDLPDAELLARARENLETYFPLAAPIDRFDDFLMGCRRMFSWRVPRYVSVNRSRGAPLDLNPGQRRALEDRLAPDREIITLATRRLDRVLSDLGVGGLERARFAAKNYGYRKLKGLRDGMRGAQNGQEGKR